MNEWISVNDRLPDEGGKYLVVDADPIFWHKQVKTAWFTLRLSSRYEFRYREQYYNENNDHPGWFNVDSDSEWEEQHITHWMPLPKLPEEEPVK